MRLTRRHAGWSPPALVWLIMVTGLLWLSGVGLHLWPQEAVMELSETAAALRRAATVSHGVLAWLFCLMAGRWIWPHVPMVWQRRGQRLVWVLGVLALGTGGCIALAGLVLLYGSPQLHDLAVPVHWWLGLLWPAWLGAHAWPRRHRRHR